MRRSARACVVAVACVVGLTACRDNGLPDRNLPRDAARHRSYGYSVYEPAQNAALISAGGHNWLGGVPAQTIPSRMLVAVSGATGAQVYALRGEQAPYGVLYMPAGENQWLPLYRID